MVYLICSLNECNDIQSCIKSDLVSISRINKKTPIDHDLQLSYLRKSERKISSFPGISISTQLSLLVLTTLEHHIAKHADKIHVCMSKHVRAFAHRRMLLVFSFFISSSSSLLLLEIIMLFEQVTDICNRHNFNLFSFSCSFCNNKNVEK